MEGKSKPKQQSEEPPTGAVSEDRIEAKIDRDLRDSFPASDPPGWVLGVKPRKAEEEEEEDDDSSSSATDDAEGS